ncbi:MAG: tryptophan synthase subunit alpha [Planctomycetia bacterium]|nr:tryptophan synthase subunit alpha [Planctomycetia bacterium]
MSSTATAPARPIERLAAVFAAHRAAGTKAVAPFVTAGDPDAATCVAVLEALDRAGASLCELGVPYSDPIADGPVIQASYTRALAEGVTLEGVFGVAREAAARVRMPILAMASYSLIFRRGIARFVADSLAAGLAGLVVPDLPLEESDELDAACRSAGLALVRLVTPTTPPERAAEIARRSTGFLYCVSVAGVTGARADLPPGLVDRVRWLRSQTDVPILVGFGIAGPEQARAVAGVADGVIVGSALVRHVAEAAGRPRDELLDAVGRFVEGLAAACR